MLLCNEFSYCAHVYQLFESMVPPVISVGCDTDFKSSMPRNSTDKVILLSLDILTWCRYPIKVSIISCKMSSRIQRQEKKRFVWVCTCVCAYMLVCESETQRQRQRQIETERDKNGIQTQRQREKQHTEGEIKNSDTRNYSNWIHVIIIVLNQYFPNYYDSENWNVFLSHYS